MAIEETKTLLKRRRTKIVATLGPASNDAETIQKLIQAGVNVFRLNFSHGSHENHRNLYELVRAQADSAGEPVAILGDLSGPKIRVGRFEGGQIELVDGETVVVTTRDVQGKTGLIPTQYEELAQDVEPGSIILLDDGCLEIHVQSIEGTEIQCVVVEGGTLKDRKGMNLPNVKVSAPSLTEKDKEDALFALSLGVDFLALSFVRSASDVQALRKLAEDAGYSTHIIAKIEKPEALKQITEILRVSDGIMVARGDLGVELPPERVPVIQDQLVELARRAKKPVIVATQMLESMIHQTRPTRAEVSDVSHAVASGTDAVMLSAESASGDNPVEAVEMMDAVARHTEARLWHTGAFQTLSLQPVESSGAVPVEDSVARATAQLSRDLQVRSIQVISFSGRTACVLSAARPAAPILAISAAPWVCRQMNLLWGTVPINVQENELGDPYELTRRLTLELDLAAEGNQVLLVRGFHTVPRHNTPNVTVLTV